MIVKVKFGYCDSDQDEDFEKFIVDTEKLKKNKRASVKLVLDIVKDAVDDVENEVSVDDEIAGAFDSAIMDGVVDTNIAKYSHDAEVTVWRGG